MRIIRNMDIQNKTPKELIIEIRDVSDMTDSDIAIGTNISQSTISRLRSGKIADTVSANWQAIAKLHKRVMRRAV